MEEKIFVTSKKKFNMPIYAVIIIVALLAGVLGSGLTYLLFGKIVNKTSTGTTSSTTNSSNVKYEISQVDNPVVAIASKVGPSIVGVKVTAVSQGNFGLLQDASDEGSGIVYSSDGYIITNYHVISSAMGDSNAKITVTLPGTSDEITATVVGGDNTTDLAVLKIDKTGLQAAEFGKSSDTKVGELAVAIGNPLGQDLANTVTGGYISAVNRKITTDGRTYNLIQTDAAINAGNSGGALINSKGQVIGINSIKISESGVEGLGFAIPADDAIPIIKELIQNKKISRPYIGIAGFDLDDQTAKQYNLVQGIYVSDITDNGPAQKAGIKKGDIVTQINGTDVKTMADLNEQKNKLKVGDKVTLKVYRSGKYTDISLTLEEDNTNN